MYSHRTRSLAKCARDFASGLPLRSRPLNGPTSARTSYQPSVVSSQRKTDAAQHLLRFAIGAVAMRHFSAMQPRPDREQRQDHKRHQSNPLIRQRFVRQGAQRRIGRECEKQPVHEKSWCTGKDSNLRTPLGGADLQSAGFNHSPTCAQTTKLPLHARSACSRQPSTGFIHTRTNSAGFATTQKNRNRANTLAHENHYTSEKFLMECFWITCCAAKLLPPPCRKIVLGAGEGI